MNTFTECFKTILTGEKADSRNAARQVRKLLYSSSHDRSKYGDIRPLTYHIRCPDRPHNQSRADKADQILFELYCNLQDLINDLSKPSYNRYKFIASLPTGPFKSIQMVMSQLMEDCGEEHMKDFENRFGSRYLNGIELGGLCDCEICRQRKTFLK